MAAKAKKKAKPKVHRPGRGQGHLPTMEPPKIKEIEAAAAEYIEARDRRMGLSKLEGEKKTILMHHMKTHGLKVYDYDNMRVQLDATENVKVNVRRPEGEDSNGEADHEE